MGHPASDESAPMSITHSYSVPAMSCEHCVNAITSEVSAVAAVEAVNVDLNAKLVTVVGGENSAIIDAIDEAGFDAVPAEEAAGR